MANPFTSKLHNCVTVGLIALTLFYASNSYAQLTIITGSYSQVDLAKKRLDDPAFKALGAYLLHSRSQQYAARVAVGCFASPELAKQALIDVRAAGAKGVWFLDVGSRCKAKGAQTGRAASAAGSSHPIHQSRNITKRILIKNAKPDVAVQSKNGDGAEANSGAVLIKREVAESEMMSPSLPVTKTIPSPAPSSENHQGPPLNFHPSRWLYKKGVAVAFTSGINPAVFKQAKSPCYIIKNYRVTSIVGIEPPASIEKYEFQADGNTCYTAHIYSVPSLPITKTITALDPLGENQTDRK